MKQKFTLKSAFTALCSLALITGLNAQTTPFSVNWSLLTDSSASVSGNVVANPQVVSTFLTPKRYGRSFDASSNTGWQGKGETQAWVAGFSTDVYDEYKIKPAPGYSLNVTQFQLSALGGGTGSMRLVVYYSKDGFATLDSLSVGSNSGGTGATYNSLTYKATVTEPITLLNTSTTPLAGKEVANFPGLSIMIAPGDSLMVRTYPYVTANGNRYYPSKQVFINGETNVSTFPVTFASTRAAQKNGGVQVDWVAATEVNVAKYVIEKSSNGRSFVEAGTVVAKGAGTRNSAYSWFDGAATQGNNYYRIKSVDKDGRSQYTSVLRVAIGRGARGFIISPNPIRGNAMNLQLSNLDKGTYNVQLLNGAGQKVFGSQLVHQGGSSSEVMQIPTLQKGLYTIQLNNGTERYNKRVVVE